MIALVTLSLLLAAPNPRLVYEYKCLYCHSAEVTESRRFTEAGWRRVVETMRLKSPLLILKSDAGPLARYLAYTLKLTPAVLSEKARVPDRASAAPLVAVAAPLPPPVPPPFPAPADEPSLPVDPAETAAEREAQAELEQSAHELIERRCTKCHTVSRAFTKLDSYERSRSTIDRMRRKTGSGISRDDFELLERFLRTQF